MQNLTSQLKQALIDNHIVLTDTVIDKAVLFLNLLVKWNKAFNLTALTETHDLIYAHTMDSLIVGPYLRGDTILDVGTGAGFPGIPLALLYPEKKFTLLDSNSKKTRFLNQVKADLELNNVDIIHARCEKLQVEQKFENIISRAFSAIAVMLGHTQHLLALDGQFLAMKGVYPTTELNDLQQNFVVKEIAPLKIVGLDVQRHIVCITRP